MRRPPRQSFDGGMVWPFLVSFATHAVVLGLLFATPNRYLAVSAPIGESYTVDLIAPDLIGGDSGPVGPGSEPDQPPAPPEPEVVAAAPPPEVEAAEQPPVEPEPEVEIEPEPPAPAEPLQPVEAPEFVEPTVPPTAAATPTASVAKPTATRPAPPTAVVAPPTKTRAVATATRAAPTAVVVKATPAPTRHVARATAAPPTPDAAAERDRRIADAIKQRAAAASQSATDEQIAAAVRRRAEQVRGGGGSGVEGPLSTGPGTGAGGGTVIGAEYILFKRRMEARIREAWVWAGAQDHLESVVRFSVSPEGEVSNIRTTHSSGDPAYDASAERAVRAASPLGLVPPDYRQEFADVEMTFRARDLQR